MKKANDILQQHPLVIYEGLPCARRTRRMVATYGDLSSDEIARLYWGADVHTVFPVILSPDQLVWLRASAVGRIRMYGDEAPGFVVPRVAPTERGALLALLLQGGRHTLTALQDRLGVSDAQLRRDLGAVRAAAARAGWAVQEEQLRQEQGPGRADKLVWLERAATAASGGRRATPAG